MKYLKTYKLFESISEKELDEICTEIKEILLPLTDEDVNFKIRPFYITSLKSRNFIDITIKNPKDLFKYADEFKRLFFTLENIGFSIESDISYFNASIAELENDTIICPNCKSSDCVDNGKGDKQSICNNCGFENDIDLFKFQSTHIDNIEQLLNILKSNKADKIILRFYENEN